MLLVELVATLAVLQYLFFTVMTGRARLKSGIKAPAVTGDPGFERMYRVQMNTLEILVMFLPAILIAAQYWSGLVIAIIGVIYLLGRLIYWRAYVVNPGARGLGFMLSILPIFALIILALIGIIMALI
jgi:hypothetical protein